MVRRGFVGVTGGDFVHWWKGGIFGDDWWGFCSLVVRRGFCGVTGGKEGILLGDWWGFCSLVERRDFGVTGGDFVHWWKGGILG